MSTKTVVINQNKGINNALLTTLISTLVKAQTVSLGTVETLAYGESAYVTIGGNDTDAILNFGVPGGLMPNHEISGYNIRFRQTESTWGDWIDLEPSHDPTIIEFRDQANDAAISAANFANSALSSANDAQDYANDAYSYWLNANDAAVNASLYMGNASVSANSAWGYMMNSEGYMDSAHSWANSAGDSASAANSSASIAANAAATFNLATAQISGFSPTSGAVANGDTIGNAFGKLEYHCEKLDTFMAEFFIAPASSLYSGPPLTWGFSGTAKRADLNCRLLSNFASVSPNSSATVTFYNNAGTSLDDITFTTGSTTDSTWNFSMYANDSYYCKLDAAHSLEGALLGLTVRGVR